jgi:hypothetical protein
VTASFSHGKLSTALTLVGMAGTAATLALAFAPASRPPAAQAPPPALAPARPQTPGPQLTSRQISPGSQATSRPAATPPTSSRLQRVITAPWGTGPGALGHALPDEGAPEGPASFLVDASGAIHVLDQVNGQIKVFRGGQPTGTLPLPGDTFQDLALSAEGRYVLLDRTLTASLAYLDAAGHIDHEIALVGEHIAEGTGVTALFARDDGMWVEIEHTRLVRVATARGEPDPDRPVVEGRLTSAPGARVSAHLLRPSGVSVSSGSPPREIARLSFPEIAWTITGLDLDPQGRVQIGVELLEERPGPPFDVLRTDHALLALDGQTGEVLSRVALPTAEGPEEVFRPLRMAPDGTMYSLRCTKSGAEIWKVLP